MVIPASAVGSMYTGTASTLTPAGIAPGCVQVISPVPPGQDQPPEFTRSATMPVGMSTVSVRPVGEPYPTSWAIWNTSVVSRSKVVRPDSTNSCMVRGPCGPPGTTLELGHAGDPDEPAPGTFVIGASATVSCTEVEPVDAPPSAPVAAIARPS